MKFNKIALVTLLLSSFFTVSCGFNKSEYKVFEKEFSESFTEISIDGSVENISILPNEASETTRIEYTESEDYKYEIRNNNGKLEIESDDNSKNKVNVKSNDNFLKIYVPNSYIANFDIDSNLGNVDINKIQVGSLHIDADLGNVEIKDVKADVVDLSSNMGNANIKNTIIESNGLIEADLGNINVDLAENENGYKLVIGKNVKGDGNAVIKAEADLGNVTLKALDLSIKK